MKNTSIAVVIPCLNEEASIAKVVSKFKKLLPKAKIYVYDNGSSDNTIAKAKKAGAIVRTEARRGKGNVVKRMFADIEADVYVMSDGDETYELTKIRSMIKKLQDEHLDMVVGKRTAKGKRAYPTGHVFGNRLINGIINMLFGSHIQDALSGLRVFSRRFVKSFPFHRSGFTIETEMTIHALELAVPLQEVPIGYRERKNSKSKLRTIPDGTKIMAAILILFQEVRPFLCYTLLALLLTGASLFLGIPLIEEYIETGLVPRLPTAILAVGIQVIAVICFFTGVILHSEARTRKDLKRLHYLQSTGS